jgi:hypothetical protein
MIFLYANADRQRALGDKIGLAHTGAGDDKLLPLLASDQELAFDLK